MPHQEPLLPNSAVGVWRNDIHNNTCVPRQKGQISSAQRFCISVFVYFLSKCGVVLHLFEINYVCFNFFGLDVLLGVGAGLLLVRNTSSHQTLDWDRHNMEGVVLFTEADSFRVGRSQAAATEGDDIQLCQR